MDKVLGRRGQLPILLLLAINSATSTFARFDAAADSPAQQISPSIIVHKQALNDDGSFNFVFAADNGLRQGERILPDGTRVGAYSYVDPNGETISVKYKAGKDGFRILEGAHIPTPPPQLSNNDPAESPTELLRLPGIEARTTPTTTQAPASRRRERSHKEEKKNFTIKRPPPAPKRIRTRGTRTRGPLVMVQRMPNESVQRVATFHMEQPTFRGPVNKVEAQHLKRETNSDFNGNPDSPKAYSFQFGSGYTGDE